MVLPLQFILFYLYFIILYRLMQQNFYEFFIINFSCLPTRQNRVKIRHHRKLPGLTERHVPSVRPLLLYDIHFGNTPLPHKRYTETAYKSPFTQMSPQLFLPPPGHNKPGIHLSYPSIPAQNFPVPPKPFYSPHSAEQYRYNTFPG